MGTIAIVVILSATISTGVFALQQRGLRLRTPIATLVVAAVVFVVSVVGELSAPVLDALGRDLPALQEGQWWRAVTPMVVQDGGWPGLIFNVIALVAIGAVAESLFTRWVVPVVFVVVGLVGELAAYTVLQHQGFAGNSVANLGVAGLVLVTGLVTPRWVARIVAVIGLAAGVVLVVTGDLHAVGIVAGAAIGVVVALRPGRYRREAPPHPE